MRFEPAARLACVAALAATATIATATSADAAPGSPPPAPPGLEVVRDVLDQVNAQLPLPLLDLPPVPDLLAVVNPPAVNDAAPAPPPVDDAAPGPSLPVAATPAAPAATTPDTPVSDAAPEPVSVAPRDVPQSAPRTDVDPALPATAAARTGFDTAPIFEVPLGTDPASTTSVIALLVVAGLFLVVHGVDRRARCSIDETDDRSLDMLEFT